MKALWSWLWDLCLCGEPRCDCVGCFNRAALDRRWGQRCHSCSKLVFYARAYGLR